VFDVNGMARIRIASRGVPPQSRSRRDSNEEADA